MSFECLFPVPSRGRAGCPRPFGFAIRKIMTDVTFRAARAEDLPVIIALLADDMLGRNREAADADAPVYLAAFAAIDADPNLLLVVAESAGAVVGTMQLSFLPGLPRNGAWRGQIEAVRVAASRRGGGVGAQMINWAIARCRERGCAHVQLTTDRQRLDAHRFYDRLGFVPSHIGYKLQL